MGTRKNEIRNQQIRFQYAGVFDGFYLSSLTPTPNPKHLLQVWNRLGAKRLFFFFCNKLPFMSASSPGLPRMLAVPSVQSQCGIVVKAQSLDTWCLVSSLSSATHWRGQFTQPSRASSPPIYEVGWQWKAPLGTVVGSKCANIGKAFKTVPGIKPYMLLCIKNSHRFGTFFKNCL